MLLDCLCKVRRGTRGLCCILGLRLLLLMVSKAITWEAGRAGRGVPVYCPGQSTGENWLHGPTQEWRGSSRLALVTVEHKLPGIPIRQKANT